MNKERPSAVEMTILGLTWVHGPCSTYTVMRQLSMSESTYHRSRAGTTYSIANRLIERGWVEKKDGDLIQVTPIGEARLREWTGPDVPMGDVAHSVDLLRLRCFFLGALPRADRLAFVDRSLASLREFERRGVGLIAENQALGDAFGAMATVGLILETRARIRWLETIRPWLEGGWADGEDWTSAALRAIDGR